MRLDPEMKDSGVLALAEGPPTTYGPQRRDDRRRDGKGQGTGGTTAGNVALDVNPFWSQTLKDEVMLRAGFTTIDGYIFWPRTFRRRGCSRGPTRGFEGSDEPEFDAQARVGGPQEEDRRLHQGEGRRCLGISRWRSPDHQRQLHRQVHQRVRPLEHQREKVEQGNLVLQRSRSFRGRRRMWKERHEIRETVDVGEIVIQMDEDLLQYQSRGLGRFRLEVMGLDAWVTIQGHLGTPHPGHLGGFGPGRGGLPDCAVRDGDLGKGSPLEQAAQSVLRQLGTGSHEGSSGEVISSVELPVLQELREGELGSLVLGDWIQLISPTI